MSKIEIERRFEKLDDSFGADNLRLIELVIRDSKKNGMSIGEIKEKYILYIPSLDKLNEKANFELRYLNKNYFDTPYHNWATGKVYNLKERIDRVKEVLLGESANK